MSSSDNEDYSPLPIRRRNPQRKTNLYVKNFDHTINESKLCQLFATYGTITSCKIAKDEYNRSKGFAFINFLTSSMAEDAIVHLNGYLLKNGRELYVAFFQNKEDRRVEQQQTYYKRCEDRNLFISNLDDSINDCKLIQAFAKYGTITSAKVMIKNGRSKGYGFVCFSSPEEASEAIEYMNGKELRGKPIYVTLGKDQKENLVQSSTSSNRLPNNLYRAFNHHSISEKIYEDD